MATGTRDHQDVAEADRLEAGGSDPKNWKVELPLELHPIACLFPHKCDHIALFGHVVIP